jgi:hypothetical protein
MELQLTSKQAQGQESLKNIITKCWEDSKFKAELIKSPVHTLEKYSGTKVDVPAGKELVVIDQTDNSKIYLNIHAKPDFDNLELSDEQLELVAGGEFFIGAAICGVAAGVIVGAIIVATK